MAAPRSFALPGLARRRATDFHPSYRLTGVVQSDSISVAPLRASGSAMLGFGLHWRKVALALIGGSFLLRLVYCGQVELLPEEAYYWNYSRHLDIGYLDHPPMVAWLIRLGTSWLGESELGVRAGALLCNAVASFFMYRLTRQWFGKPSALVAVVLMQLLPCFFLSGLIMTPDAPLMAAWAAALYYLQAALLAERGKSGGAWWGVAISVGLGLIWQVHHRAVGSRRVVVHGVGSRVAALAAGLASLCGRLVGITAVLAGHPLERAP
jgi:Dolichyl-phosphate-mannose-protein mannosyltransferase